MKKMNQWCDFYMFPPYSDFVTSEDRIGDTPRKTEAQRMTREILEADEEIVQMIFDDYGGLQFWTTKRTWVIRTAGGLDRLIYLDRNPPEVVRKNTNHWRDFYAFVPRNGEVSYEDRMGLTEKKARGYLITRDYIPWDEEIIQVIFSDDGGVHFWTAKRAWANMPEFGMDKILFLYRNPPEERLIRRLADSIKSAIRRSKEIKEDKRDD